MKKFKQNKLKYILGIIALVLMILVGAFSGMYQIIIKLMPLL